MIENISQWLKERHILPFRDPDVIFACSSDSEAKGGVVKAVLENPVYEAKMRPPEDNLVISFNNPLFKPSNPLWYTALSIHILCIYVYYIITCMTGLHWSYVHSNLSNPTLIWATVLCWINEVVWLSVQEIVTLDTKDSQHCGRAYDNGQSPDIFQPN